MSGRQTSVVTKATVFIQVIVNRKHERSVLETTNQGSNTNMSSSASIIVAKGLQEVGKRVPEKEIEYH